MKVIQMTPTEIQGTRYYSELMGGAVTAITETKYIIKNKHSRCIGQHEKYILGDKQAK